MASRFLADHTFILTLWLLQGPATCSWQRLAELSLPKIEEKHGIEAAVSKGQAHHQGFSPQGLGQEGGVWGRQGEYQSQRVVGGPADKNPTTTARPSGQRRRVARHTRAPWQTTTTTSGARKPKINRAAVTEFSATVEPP